MYCFDPRQFIETPWGHSKCGPYGAQFRLESVRQLLCCNMVACWIAHRHSVVRMHTLFRPLCGCCCDTGRMGNHLLASPCKQVRALREALQGIGSDLLICNGKAEDVLAGQQYRCCSTLVWRAMEDPMLKAAAC